MVKGVKGDSSSGIVYNKVKVQEPPGDAGGVSENTLQSPVAP
jgi:hypothetical protein